MIEIFSILIVVVVIWLYTFVNIHKVYIQRVNLTVNKLHLKKREWERERKGECADKYKIKVKRVFILKINFFPELLNIEKKEGDWNFTKITLSEESLNCITPIMLKS